MRYLSSLLTGVLFGVGLALAGMTSAQKVLAFLDVAGAWDPSLLFVLGGAVLTAALGYRVVLARRQPLFEARFHLGASGGVDTALLGGSALFGVGWGIGGYCPGPAVALLAVPGNPEAWLFLSGLLAGVLLHFAWSLRTAAQAVGA